MGFILKYVDREVPLSGSPESILKLMNSMADSALPELVDKLIGAGADMTAAFAGWFEKRTEANRLGCESRDQTFTRAFVGSYHKPPRDPVGARMLKLSEEDRHVRLQKTAAAEAAELVAKAAPKVRYDSGGKPKDLRALVGDVLQKNPGMSRAKATDAAIKSDEFKAMRAADRKRQGIAV